MRLGDLEILTEVSLSIIFLNYKRFLIHGAAKLYSDIMFLEYPYKWPLVERY
jgi:hypothetical protein